MKIAQQNTLTKNGDNFVEPPEHPKSLHMIAERLIAINRIFAGLNSDIRESLDRIDRVPVNVPPEVNDVDPNGFISAINQFLDETERNLHCLEDSKNRLEIIG